VPDLREIDDWPVPHAPAAAVAPDGSVVLHGDVDRPFALASVTKVLVAVAVHAATEDGTLSLDGAAGPPGSTVRHLLAHASGLGLDDDRPLAAPGTRRIYSNRGFEVLGELLEARSGLGAATWVDEAVCRPVGMAGTHLDGSPAHGAVGTCRDLARLARDLLDDAPTALAAATRDVAVSTAFDDLPGVLPGFGPQDPNPWGLGVEVRGTKSPHWTPDTASPTTYGHFGRSGTFVWCDPVQHRALVVLTDREFGEWAPPRWRSIGARVLAEV
jgi:CubicO group peptidase (beta-lactamase class C family)